MLIVACNRCARVVRRCFDFAAFGHGGFMTQTIFVGGMDKRSEQRMRIERLRFVLRMKLAAEKPRVDIAREFDYFDKLFIRRNAAED